MVIWQVVNSETDWILAHPNSKGWGGSLSEQIWWCRYFASFKMPVWHVNTRRQLISKSLLCGPHRRQCSSEICTAALKTCPFFNNFPGVCCKMDEWRNFFSLPLPAKLGETISARKERAIIWCVPMLFFTEIVFWLPGGRNWYYLLQIALLDPHWVN